MVRWGEVWWFEPPREKPRPVCVLTRNEAIPLLSRVVVVKATSTIRGIPSEVQLGADDGMPQACALSFDNVATVRKAHLTRPITTLSPIRMHEVCAALAVATGC